MTAEQAAEDAPHGQPPILRKLIEQSREPWFHRHDTAPQEAPAMTTPATQLAITVPAAQPAGILDAAQDAAAYATTVLNLAAQLQADKLTAAAIAARDRGVDPAVRESLADAISKIAGTVGENVVPPEQA